MEPQTVRKLLPGIIIQNKTGKRCAVIYMDKGKVDLLFSNKFQIKDVPVFNVIVEYTFIKDCGSVIDAIEEICNDQRRTAEPG